MGGRGRGLRAGPQVPHLVRAAPDRLRRGRAAQPDHPHRDRHRGRVESGRSRRRSRSRTGLEAPDLRRRRQGARLFHWAVAWLPVGEHTPPGWGRWLLVRRQILTPDQIDAGKKPELAYYLCTGPPGSTDEDLIRVAGARWAIEECLQTAKTEVGLDQYQVRRYERLVPPHHARHAGPRLPVGHRRDRPKKTWQRPHPAHPRRDPPSPGTPNPDPQPSPYPGVVGLAQTPPTRSSHQPLQATNRHPITNCGWSTRPADEEYCLAAHLCLLWIDVCSDGAGFSSLPSRMGSSVLFQTRASCCEAAAQHVAVASLDRLHPLLTTRMQGLSPTGRRISSGLTACATSSSTYSPPSKYS
jgi:hypothetical protein